MKKLTLICLLLTALTALAPSRRINSPATGSIATGGGGSTTPGVFDSNAVYSTGVDNSTNTIASVPAGAVLVALVGSAGDLDSATITSNPSLTWNQVTNVNTANVASSAIFIATFSAGGTIYVTNRWTTTYSNGGTLIAVTNTEGTWGGTKLAQALTSGLPDMTPTSTRANSILFCQSTDWNATSGAATYLNTPVTTVQDALSVGNARFYAWYKTTTSVGGYQIGLSAPSGQAPGFCTVEIRGP